MTELEYKIEITTEPELTDEQGTALFNAMEMSVGGFPAAKYLGYSAGTDGTVIEGYVQRWPMGDNNINQYVTYLADLIFHLFAEVEYVNVEAEQTGEVFPDTASEECDRAGTTPTYDIAALLEAAKDKHTTVEVVVCYLTKKLRKSWVKELVGLEGHVEQRAAELEGIHIATGRMKNREVLHTFVSNVWYSI